MKKRNNIININNKQPCLIIAHRGASAHREGNTLDAFKLAIDHGVDAVEMDIRQTKDGHIIVMHNGKIRKGRRKIPIKKLTLKQIASLTGSALLLNDVVKILKSKTILDIDIKEPGLEKKLIALLRRHRIKRNQVMINCGRINVLEEVRRYWPDAPLVLSFVVFGGVDIANRKVLSAIVAAISASVRRVVLRRFVRKAINHKLYGVSLPYTFIHKRLVETFHKNGIRVYAWPPRSETSMRKLLALGVDGIKTGRTDLLVAEVKKYKNE